MKKCFQIPQQSNCTSWGLLLLRVVVGLALMFHGYGKIQAPMSWMPPESGVPGVLQFLAAFSEFGGGFALIVGLLSRLASLGIAITMLVATILHAVVMKDAFVATAQGQNSYELPLILLTIAVLIVLAGPGQFSLDKIVFKEK